MGKAIFGFFALLGLGLDFGHGVASRVVHKLGPLLVVLVLCATACVPQTRKDDKQEPCWLLYDNWNVGAVGNNGKNIMITVPAKAPDGHNVQQCNICRIDTYHWNGGQGAVPGKVSVFIPATGLTDTPPNNATATPGAGGAPNVNWSQTGFTAGVPAGGQFEVRDSNPGTWSQNAQTNGFGYTRVWCWPEI